MRIKCQNLARAPYCKHLQKLQSSIHPIHPLATKVRVTAKLSMEDAREDENYQQFPKHFFELWSGFNILSPIHDPTPIGPSILRILCPKGRRQRTESFHRTLPQPIDPATLSIDDKYVNFLFLLIFIQSFTPLQQIRMRCLGSSITRGHVGPRLLVPAQHSAQIGSSLSAPPEERQNNGANMV